MRVSTITEATDATAMLDPAKMQQLRQDIRTLFPDISDIEFELIWRGKCSALTPMQLRAVTSVIIDHRDLKFLFFSIAVKTIRT